MKEQCKSCRYFKAADDGVEGDGVCRRYAPKPAGDSYARVIYWPIVSGDDWCGEYKAK